MYASYSSTLSPCTRVGYFLCGKNSKMPPEAFFNTKIEISSNNISQIHPYLTKSTQTFVIIVFISLNDKKNNCKYQKIIILLKFACIKAEKIRIVIINQGRFTNFVKILLYTVVFRYIR